MREPVEHELKVLPQFYSKIRCHRKTFEIRKDDRDYQVGDRVRLREWDGEKYTGSQTRREITYILRDAEEYGLMKGFCILGLQSIGWDYIRPAVTLDVTCNQTGNNATFIDHVETLTM